MGICAFCYMWNLLGVKVLHRYIVQWEDVHLPWIYVHSPIGELIECNGAASIYSQLTEGLSAMAYVHSAIVETYWV